jgi:hypothetical protein
MEELTALIREFVRGERDWRGLERYGLHVNTGNPSSITGLSALPVVSVTSDDLIRGLQNQSRRGRRALREWGLVVMAGPFDFGGMTDTALGDHVVDLVWDAADGRTPGDILAALAALGF